MEEQRASGRIEEIDIAKGMACLLMITAHFIYARLLPFGTFAAPLFFACSGMNTIVLIEKTRGNRCFDLYHMFFPLLLFFGGATQVVIAHGGRLRVFPEFLQCIAMALLVLFLLSKILRDPLIMGCLFPVPFLVQQLLRLTFYDAPRNLLFSRGFALFPWLGFFLFGVLLLRLEKKQLPRLAAVLAAATALSLWLSGRMPDKFAMSPSYVFMALLAVSLFFILARWLAGRAERVSLRKLAEFFALPGRNALMFVYVHYFALRYLGSGDFFPHFLVYLVLEPLYLYSACWVMLRVYEGARHETALLYPVLLLFLALGTLRWSGLLAPRADLRLVDLAVGVLFAFAYVLLRRKFAACCRRPRAAGG